nr:putative CDC50/LEM3 family [Tanacetum cinerariifolium]
MKFSLKLLDDHSKTQKIQSQNQNPIHFSAKIPIAVFGLPFLSAFTTTHNHPSTNNLSLSLRTHFSSGPSLKLSYNATSPPPPATSPPPLTLTLKSGISLSGSPNNSPLTISANFSFSPHNPNPNPTFLIHFKPKMGSFSLRKAISSVTENEGKKVSGNGVENGENADNSYGFVPLDRTVSWKGMTVDSVNKDSILSGVLVSADTELPITKRVKVNLRWGVGIPSDFDKQLPYLRVNKIKIERIDEVKEEESQKASELGEFDMLKGMYSFMTKELSDLQAENREMRRALEDIKSRQLVRNQSNGYSVGVSGGKRTGPVVEATTDGFEQWRAKKKGGGGGEANGHREVKKNVGSSDVESELQRAIKAASSP